MPEYKEKVNAIPPKKRKHHDYLMNYVMTQLPIEHEKSIKMFAERALNEAYANGLSQNRM